MAVSWSATPLVVSPADESADGRVEEDELRDEQESEVANDVGEHNDSAIEDVHQASKRTDAADTNKKEDEGNKSLISEESKFSAIEVLPEATKETELADSERKEEEGNKAFYACQPKDSVEDALHQTAKETESAYQTAKETEAADSKREEVRKKDAEDAKDTQEQEHSAIVAGAAKAPVAETVVHRSVSQKVSERKKKAPSEFEIEAARKIQSVPNESTVILGFGNYTFENFCYRIGSNSSLSRHSGTSPITCTHPPTSRRENHVGIFLTLSIRKF